VLMSAVCHGALGGRKWAAFPRGRSVC